MNTFFYHYYAFNYQYQYYFPQNNEFVEQISTSTQYVNEN
jgi:hypothetical protein